jgi:hypothetical protein
MLFKHFIFWAVVLVVIYMVGTIEVIFPFTFIPAIVLKPIEQKEDK